jgi:hypothetical protein
MSALSAVGEHVQHVDNLLGLEVPSSHYLNLAFQLKVFTTGWSHSRGTGDRVDVLAINLTQS